MIPARRDALAAVPLVLLSALFFTSTQVLDRAAALDGGRWARTAAAEAIQVAGILFAALPGETRPRGIAAVGAGVVVLAIVPFSGLVASGPRDRAQRGAVRKNTRP